MNPFSKFLNLLIITLHITLQNDAQTRASAQTKMSDLSFTSEGGINNMYFTGKIDDSMQNHKTAQKIKVIELRNYLIKPGRRDEFINYFEENFINSQNALGGYILGQYRVKDADDNFFWMRGFPDMPSRYKFLNDFYYSPFWKAHKTVPNSLLLNNDNVYLLKPLDVNDSSISNETAFNSAWFGKEKGIAVLDLYISNTKLDKLIEFIKKQYNSILSVAGVQNTSFWVSETATNEFTALPVFQDKNLLVQITFYKDELEYQTKMKAIDSKMNEEQKTQRSDLVTIKSTLILYPTNKSFSSLQESNEVINLKKCKLNK